MKKSRFRRRAEHAALRQAESGMPVGDVCRMLQITEQTFHSVWNR